MIQLWVNSQQCLLHTVFQRVLAVALPALPLLDAVALECFAGAATVALSTPFGGLLPADALLRLGAGSASSSSSSACPLHRCCTLADAATHQMMLYHINCAFTAHMNMIIARAYGGTSSARGEPAASHRLRLPVALLTRPRPLPSCRHLLSPSLVLLPALLVLLWWFGRLITAAVLARRPLSARTHDEHDDQAKLKPPAAVDGSTRSWKAWIS